MPSLIDRLKSAFSPPTDRPSFASLCHGFSERLAKWPLIPGPERRADRIAVLVTPWLGTAVPFLSLEVALMLARAGCQMSVIWDDADLVGNAPRDGQSKEIAKIIARLGAPLHVIRAEDLPPGEPDVEAAERSLQSNAIWRMRGEDKAGEFFETRPGAREKIAAHIGAIERWLREAKFDWIFLPGGIFGLSGSYVAAARNTGTRFTTYDSGVGVLRLAHDAIASHLGDLPRSFSALQPVWRQNPEECERVIQQARSEIGDRSAAKDFRQFQVAPAGRDDLRYDILVPLNIRWDSAALERQRLFTSVSEWITSLLEWVDAHPGTSICLRQHPRERLDFARGSDTLAPILNRFAHLGERLRFVGAEEALSTYDLLRHAKIVLPHTSTVGIEAALLGKPVALSTRCYYEDFGFCRVASTREEYFHFIEEACRGSLAVSARETEDAALAYYLTQRCALLRTPLTGDPKNAVDWMAQPPQELWATEELSDYRQALLDHEPLSLVRYRRSQNAG